MRRSVIAAAVTTCLVAATTLRTRRAHRQLRASHHPAQAASDDNVPAVIPTQRPKTDLERLVDGDAELVLADQEAQDDHILAALDHLLAGSAHPS